MAEQFGVTPPEPRSYGVIENFRRRPGDDYE
jgi:hypothetical protein